MRGLAVAVGMVLAAAGAAFGDPLAGSSLPADTRWVIHVDVDGARQAKPLWEAARGRLGDLPRAALMPRAAVLERVTGMKIPQELQDVSLYSSSFEEADACLRIHGKMNREQVASFLKGDQEFKELEYGKYAIMQWRDKARERIMFVAFAQENLAVLSPNVEAVEKSLDTLDGKAGGLKADSPLAPGAPEGGAKPFVWLAAEKLGELPRGRAESPVVTPVEAASIGIRWASERVVTDVRVTARSAQAAQQLKAVADGVKAFVELSGADEHAPPALRVLAGTMDQFTVQTEGKTLRGNWAVGIDKIEMLLNVAALEQGAETTQPATAAGNLP